MNRFVNISVGIFMAAGVLSAGVIAAEKSLTDAEFVYQASEVGIIEVAMGRVALQNSKSSDVQRFALATIDEYDTTNDELKIIARRKGLTLIDESAALQKAETIAADLTDGNFDADYAARQVQAHEAAVNLLKNADGQLKDEELQNYVRETLPKWERHLVTARELAQKKN